MRHTRTAPRRQLLPFGSPRAGFGDDATDEALRPVIGALRDVETALRQERIDRAWVDLDIAALRLARHDSQAHDGGPAVERAIGAVERARDLLGRAEVAQATAVIAGALMALTG